MDQNKPTDNPMGGPVTTGDMPGTMPTGDTGQGSTPTTPLADPTAQQTPPAPTGETPVVPTGDANTGVPPVTPPTDPTKQPGGGL